MFGDIHGYPDRAVKVLAARGLVAPDGAWTGGASQLWFTGDFTDRGPNGFRAIEWVMNLQAQAAAQGGTVGAVLGNHDVALLSAYLFPNAPTSGPRGTFYADWLEYGGIENDVKALQPRHVDWLLQNPAMARIGNRLLVHADALFYTKLGDTVDAVNAATRELLANRVFELWDQLLGYAAERCAFDEKHGGARAARQFLEQYGGIQLIHGHTPISDLRNVPVERVTRPYVYAEGLAVDVDGGMYLGGAGVLLELFS